MKKPAKKTKAKKEIKLDDSARMMANGFSGVDKQFAEMSGRFTQIDNRFEQVDKRKRRAWSACPHGCFSRRRNERDGFKNYSIGETSEIKPEVKC